VLPQAASTTFIADDEHVVACALAAMLRKNGFSARFFTCPLEALAAARSKTPDQHQSSSCFDEDHTPVWAYWYKDPGADVRPDPFVRARARVEMASGRNILRTGQVLSNIALDLEIEGHRIRLEGVEMTVGGTPTMAAPE
jgi:hypothetical protein